MAHEEFKSQREEQKAYFFTLHRETESKALRKKSNNKTFYLWRGRLIFQGGPFLLPKYIMVSPTHIFYMLGRKITVLMLGLHDSLPLI
jgi:hypothetical protein